MIGERRFLGLYTHTAYHASPREIPILRRKVDAVLERAAFPHGQPQREGAARDPRELPARRAVPDLRSTTCSRSRWGSCTWASASALRLFVRRDTFDRFLSCLVFVPRDRFNTENRRRIERDPAAGRPGPRASTTRRASPSRCWCGCTTWSTRSPGTLPRARRARDRDAARGRDALVGRRPRGGAPRGARRGARRRAVPPLRRRLPGRLPRRLGAALGAGRHRAASRSSTQPDDLALRPLPPARGAARARCAPRSSAPARRWRCPTCCRCSRTWASRSPTSAPTRSRPRERERVWIYDFGLTYARRATSSRPTSVREAFQDAFIRAWRGDAENDGYNRLVLRAGLTWREIDRAARDRPLPAPGRHDVQRPLRGAGAGRAPARGAAAGRPVPRALRARARATPAAAERLVEQIERGDRRGREPRPGPHPAHLPGRASGRCCARTSSSAAPTAGASPTSRSSSTRRGSPGCRCRGRASRSSSTRRAPRACTCAAARWRAAASAGRTGARTSAPRCSA